MHKVVELPEGIKVDIVTEINLAKKPVITAAIESDLRTQCPYCHIENCNFDCDDSQVAYSQATEVLTRNLEFEIEQEVITRLQWNAAVDGVQSMILACAGAGIDIATPAFSGAVQSALDAIGNEYGE
jgi:hypothetical protein